MIAQERTKMNLKCQTLCKLCSKEHGYRFTYEETWYMQCNGKYTCKPDGFILKKRLKNNHWDIICKDCRDLYINKYKENLSKNYIKRADRIKHYLGWCDMCEDFKLCKCKCVQCGDIDCDIICEKCIQKNKYEIILKYFYRKNYYDIFLPAKKSKEICGLCNKYQVKNMHYVSYDNIHKPRPGSYLFSCNKCKTKFNFNNCSLENFLDYFDKLNEIDKKIFIDKLSARQTSITKPGPLTHS